MKSKLSWQLFLLLGLILILMSSLVACSEAIQGPVIGFDPSSLSFVAEEGGQNPPSQTLEIRNAGIGAMLWAVALSSDAAWLSLSPPIGTSSSEIDKVTVTVDISGMSTGDYSATITITAEKVPNTPQTVPVDLSIG
ncbi:hypothetical protein ES706_01324 [subsurface metagenome]|nr:hypothetical protein [Dehalococcoidia bacterium]